MARSAAQLDQRISELDETISVLRSQWERDRRALAALYNISLACRGMTDFAYIFGAIERELRAVFAFDACYLALCDSERPEFFRAVLMVDEGVSEYDEDIPFGSLTGMVVHSRQPRLFRDLAEERARIGQTPHPFGNQQKLSRSWLGVPLQVGEDTVGVISIQSYQPGIYGESDADLLQHLGNVVAVALENAKLDLRQRTLSTALADQVAARTIELATLSAIAAELVLQHPLPALLNQALDLIVPLFGMDAGTVRLLDPQRDLLALVAQRGFTAEYEAAAAIIMVDGSTQGTVVRENRPLVIPEGALNQATRSLGIQVPYVALLSVPLRAGERVLGTLSLASQQRRPFTQQEVDLAQAIGNQIAIAVENARLFEAQQRQIKERERQIHELDAIGQIGQLISASFDFEEMLDGVYRTLHNLTRASVFYLAICDHETKVVTNAIFIEQGERITIDWSGQPLLPGSLTGWIMQQREALLFQDIRQQRDLLEARGIAPQPLGPENEVHSWVGVPLLAKDGDPIGVLSLQDYQPDCYDSQTVDFLSQVASHISLGVQKVRLFQENARLYAESMARVEQELEIARRIQSNLFPHDLPRCEGLAIDARCLPARETGGDFYDFIEIDRDSSGVPLLGVVVGDASGKSVPGAMLMAIARSITRSEARDHHTPQVVMRETNNLVAHDVPRRSFVALAYATIDIQRRRLALANAGQLTPLRLRRDGQISYLDVPGPRLPLGILPDTPYAALEITLDPGDLLVFVTDGIVEAKNPGRRLFGFERLELLVREYGALEPHMLVERILEAIELFMAGAPQHDDMTIVALRIA